jgi:light-regulated signal transduction histidine kinase (bacteriophytochrome)
MNELAEHLETLKRHLEQVWPSLRKSASLEQRQIVGAMYDAVTLVEPLYEQFPSGDADSWNQWRHDTIRPLSLCINSAELLLTDTENPLTEAQRQAIQAVFDTAMQMTAIIDGLYDQQKQG